MSTLIKMRPKKAVLLIPAMRDKFFYKMVPVQLVKITHMQTRQENNASLIYVNQLIIWESKDSVQHAVNILTKIKPARGANRMIVVLINFQIQLENVVIVKITLTKMRHLRLVSLILAMKDKS